MLNNKEPKRAFFKCTDCLTAFAIENVSNRNMHLKCACGGSTEFMGYVIKDKCVSVEEKSACDARCTEAQGPSCNCECGGENHGSGKVIQIHTTLEGINVAQIVDADAIERGKTWRALVQAAQKRIEAKYWETYVAYKANQFIANKDLYFEIKSALTALSRVKYMRIAKARINAIIKIAA